MFVPVFVEPDKKFTDAVIYTFRLLARNKNIQIDFCKHKNENTINVTDRIESDMPVSDEFYSKIEKGLFNHREHFDKSCHILTRTGAVDFLATAFYMMNCCQENYSKETDEFGRFKYEDSYQKKFNNIQENLVQFCFDEIVKHPKFNACKNNPVKSKIFLSHDIDLVKEGMKEEAISALRAGNFGFFVKLFTSIMFRKPYWLNVDKIMKLESAHDLKSTFYWLVNKGKSYNRLANADYDINNRNIRRAINKVNKNGYVNGIHKSISRDTFRDEINKLGFTPLCNRYHYLKFRLPQAFDELENSGIPLDTSIGFPEMIGFRNSYGLPFQPYNFATRKSYSFIEMPLHVMDRTLHSYQKEEPSQIASKVISFFEKNKYNCILSVLWHNNFFSGYTFKGYPQAYRKLLEYFYESGYECVTPVEVVKGFVL